MRTICSSVQFSPKNESVGCGVFIPLLKSPALLVKTSGFPLNQSMEKHCVVRCYMVKIPWLNNLRLPEICLLQSNKTQLWFYNFIIYDFITYKRCANKSNAFFVMMYMILTIVLWYIVIINGSLRQWWFLKMLDPQKLSSTKMVKNLGWFGGTSISGNLHRIVITILIVSELSMYKYVYIIWFTHWGSLT